MGSGDGLLGGGGGLSGSSASSRASSLICTAGSGQDGAPGTPPPEDTAAEQGGCEEELGPAGGVLVGKRDQGCVGQMVLSGTCGDFFPSHGVTDKTSIFPSVPVVLCGPPAFVADGTFLCHVT